MEVTGVERVKRMPEWSIAQVEIVSSERNRKEVRSSFVRCVVSSQGNCRLDFPFCDLQLAPDTQDVLTASPHSNNN